MYDLLDFLATRPSSVTERTSIANNRVIMPDRVDAITFYKKFKTKVDSEGINLEKLIYVAARTRIKPYIDTQTLLFELALKKR